MDDSNRLIYRIADDKIEILQCCSHYRK
ncbi:MAG: type II toxin-antitoxin system YoeB family toxin [Lachnospiraceae bacterium]|nr:type II toxin-antitoxin system YoeB family toxin [Lachnospiraceae bacterium]